MDLERELTRVLRTRDVPPLANPVEAVRAGMRRRRRVRQLHVVAGAVAVAGVVGAVTWALPPEAREHPDVPRPGAGGAVVGDPVPDGFHASDLSWVSAQDGFAVGRAPCGDATCTHVLRTVDGGTTWWDAPATGLPSGCDTACPTRVRFADRQVGYVFGNGLLMTTDGGATWVPQPGPDTHGLEVAEGTAVRVVTRSPGCPGCRFEVQRSTVGSTVWQTVTVSDELRSSADLARQVEHVAVALRANPAGGASDAHIRLLLSSDGGTTWTRREDPCAGTGDNDPDEVDAAQVQWSLTAELVVLCQRRLQRTNGGNSMITLSTDGGRAFSTPTGFPEATDAFLVAAAGGGVLLAETHQENSSAVVLLRSSDRGQSWTEVARAPAASGSHDDHYLAFSTPLVATWVAPGGTVVRRSTDGGVTWTEHQFRG